MARLEDKIAEIADGSLRQAIAEEVAKLKKRTRFGLVYEEHQPEVVPVHGARIKRGERVALRTGSLIDIWRAEIKLTRQLKKVNNNEQHNKKTPE